MLKLLLAAAVACPRAVAINSKGAPSVEVKMNLFAKNKRGESCASDEGLSDIDQQLLDGFPESDSARLDLTPSRYWWMPRSRAGALFDFRVLHSEGSRVFPKC